MRRTAFIAVSLAALTAALAAAAPAPSTARTSSHRRAERAAVSRHASTSRSAAHRTSLYRTSSYRTSSYRTAARRFRTPERRISYEPERSRLAAERRERYEAVERLAVERHDRYEAELRARYAAERRSRCVGELTIRYEELYNASYAAARATARSQAASAAGCPATADRRAIPAGPSTRPAAIPAATLESRAFAHPSAASGHAASRALDASETDTANLAPVPPVTPSAPDEQTPYTAESATYNTTQETTEDTTQDTTQDGSQALRHPPVTLEASLVMLREPVPPPLRGTLASLERQNNRLNAEGLSRIQNDTELQNWIAERLLVPLPVSDGLAVNPSLPALRRYCRPWTAQFLADLARIHDALFHRPLTVDSAVRPVSYQERLMEINGNAAPAFGQIASPHETGASVDIGKRGMTGREIGWMRRYLLALQNAGLIDVEEEFEQACFHITVYENYAPARPLRRALHNSRRDADADTASVAADTPGE